MVCMKYFTFSLSYKITWPLQFYLREVLELKLIRSSTTLTLSAALSVDTIINAVKLTNAGKAIGKIPIINKLTRALTRTTRLYQKLTTHLTSKVPLLTRYIELISIHDFPPSLSNALARFLYRRIQILDIDCLNWL